MNGVTFCPIDFSRYLDKYLKEIREFRVIADYGNVACFLSTDKMYMSCHPNILFIGEENNNITIHNVVSINIEKDGASRDGVIDNITVECSDSSKYHIFAERKL